MRATCIDYYCDFKHVDSELHIRNKQFHFVVSDPSVATSFSMSDFSKSFPILKWLFLHFLLITSETFIVTFEADSHHLPCV